MPGVRFIRKNGRVIPIGPKKEVQAVNRGMNAYRASVAVSGGAAIASVFASKPKHAIMAAGGGLLGVIGQAAALNHLNAHSKPLKRSAKEKTQIAGENRLRTASTVMNAGAGLALGAAGVMARESLIAGMKSGKSAVDLIGTVARGSLKALIPAAGLLVGGAVTGAVASYKTNSRMEKAKKVDFESSSADLLGGIKANAAILGGAAAVVGGYAGLLKGGVAVKPYAKSIGESLRYLRAKPVRSIVSNTGGFGAIRGLLK